MDWHLRMHSLSITSEVSLVLVIDKICGSLLGIRVSAVSIADRQE